jgi:hypothetical protein
LSIKEKAEKAHAQRNENHPKAADSGFFEFSFPSPSICMCLSKLFFVVFRLVKLVCGFLSQHYIIS